MNLYIQVWILLENINNFKYYQKSNNRYKSLKSKFLTFLNIITILKNNKIKLYINL